MTRAALLGAAAAAVLGWVPVSPAGASASHHHGATGGAQAFLLSSSPDSVTDLRAHAGDISVVYPTYYECTPSGGGVAGADAPAIDALAHADAIPVVPRFNCQDGAVVHRLLTEPGPRAQLLAKLTALARRTAYAGLCLDLENDGPGDREALTSFVSELGAETAPPPPPAGGGGRWGHPRRTGRPLLLLQRPRALRSGGHRVRDGLGDALGRLIPGRHLDAVVRQRRGRLPRTLPERSRFVVGAPMYGLDWTGAAATGQTLSSQSAGPASAYQYNHVVQLAHSVGAHAVRDPLSGELSFSYTGSGGVPHQVWYMDATAILDVLRIARDAGFQVGLWRLGSEDQALWSSPLVR